jgi:hypothetical protein
MLFIHKRIQNNSSFSGYLNNRLGMIGSFCYRLNRKFIGLGLIFPFRCLIKPGHRKANSECCSLSYFT